MFIFMLYLFYEYFLFCFHPKLPMKNKNNAF